MKKCSLPTRKECFEIIRRCRVPPHIVKHCLAVAKLAVFLAHKLKDNAIAVNIELVDRASLLHDILRVCDMTESDYRQFERPVTERDKAIWGLLKAKYNGMCHEEAACELLKAKYPALALTIKKHRYTAILDNKEKPSTWEEKLLYYADKRVMHDRIVPLKDRLKEAHERNARLRRMRAQSKISTTEVDSLIFKLEEEIFSRIALTPAEVTNEIIESYSNTQNPTSCSQCGDS